MDACKYCKGYHPEGHVCDEYIKWLEKQPMTPPVPLSKALAEKLETELQNLWEANDDMHFTHGVLWLWRELQPVVDAAQEIYDYNGGCSFVKDLEKALRTAGLIDSD